MSFGEQKLSQLKIVIILLFGLPFAGAWLKTDAAGAFAQNTTRFRGANGQGVFNVSNLPEKWSDQGYSWKTTLPGLGHSSPVIWGDRIFVTSADGKADLGWLFALDKKDGKILWRREFQFSSYKINSKNSYASSTPTVDAQRVYCLWYSQKETRLAAFTHAGKRVWSKSFGGVYSRHGAGSSPIIVGDLVVFTREQESVKNSPFAGEWVAVEKETGEAAWRLKCKTVKSNSQSTPIVLQQDGKSLLLFTSEARGFAAVDAKTGVVVWEVNPFDSRAVGSPILADGLVIGGCKSRLFAIKANAEHGAEVAWQLPHKYSPYVPTPIAVQGLLFNFADNGWISCHKAATGDLLWREKPTGGFYASPIYADGKLYGVSRDGRVVVLKMEKRYNLLAVNNLGEGTHATPAALEGALIFRTFSHVICVRSTN